MSERRLRTLIDAMPDFVCFLDKNGRIELNRYGRQLLNVTDVECKDLTLVELCAKCPLFAELIDSDVTVHKVEMADGTSRTFDILRVSVLNEAGGQEGRLILGRDTTEMQAAIEDLQEKEQLYRSIMEGSEIAIYLSQDGICVLSNDAGYEMIGVESTDQVIGRSILEFMHPDFIKSMVANDGVQGRRVYDEEYIYRVDGRPMPVQTVVSPVTYQGKPAMHIFIKNRTDIKQVEKQLSESEAKYQMIAENTSDLIVLLDTFGTIHYASPSHEAVLGYPVDQLIGENSKKIIYGPDQRRSTRIFLNCIESQQTAVLEYRCQTQSGEIATFEAKCSPVVDVEGVVSRIMVVSRDITQRKIQELILEENEQRYKSLFENNLNAVISLDLEGRILSMNRAAEALTGYTFEEMRGRTFLQYLSDSRYQYGKFSIQKVKSGTPHYGETVWVGKHGQALTLEVGMIPIHVNGEITGVYLMIKDVTEQKRAEELISHMAYYDSLTDLPNRTLFREHVEKALQDRQEDEIVAILFADLDHFKHVNDTMGHFIGDQLLKVVAERLRECVPHATSFSRISGDEFVILLTQLPDRMVAADTARDVLDALHRPFSLDGQLVYLTGSIGIVLAPEHGCDPETLLQNADIAMYEAKDKGKNNYRFFDFVLTERMAKRVELERAMRTAMDRDEFALYYQPLIDAKTSLVVGAEALIRWFRPGHGLVSPAEFIPIAEETGLIVDIGDWVLRTACLHQVQWARRGFEPIHLSVNLSTRQFQEPNFLERVRRIVQETGVDLNWIGFEITESLIMKDVDYAIKILKELRDMGGMISIDDFGTGYSSLAYLKTFPIDKLKIDRTFVKDITTRTEDEAITKTVITLAKSLHLRVVAEGVETIDQIEKLKQLECDEFQGYYFGKPIPVQEFTALLTPLVR